MQKNGKVFTFLISHSSKSRIYIRRIELPESLLQNASLASIIVIGLAVFSASLAEVFDKSVAGVSRLTSVVERTAQQASPTVYASSKVMNYSRPAVSSAADVTPNSGGPVDDSVAVLDDPVVESQLKALQANGDRQYLPSIWAHAGIINNEFGFRRNPFGGRSYEFHAGLDIDGERGDLVVAPASGTVVKAGWNGGYGNLVEVDHGNGLITRYAHLSKIDVQVGDVVRRGQLMAYVGSTGRSTGPHLHYEIRFNDKPVNPRRFLPPEPPELRN